MPEVLNSTTVVAATGSGLKPDAYYTKALLEMLRNTKFVHRQYLKVQKMIKNYGNVINFRRYGKLAVKSTALTEGVPPEGVAMTGTSVSATINQYGNVIKSTDRVANEFLDDLKMEYGQELAVNAAESLDYIAREALYTEASDFFSKGTEDTRPTTLAALTATCVPAIADFRYMALAMQSANIRPVRSAGGKYVCIVDATVMYDLLDDPKLDKFMTWGNTNRPVVDNEIYEIYNLRFVVITNAKAEVAGAGNALKCVHSLVLGNEAAAEVDLAGADIQMFTKGLGSAGTADPLNQIWTMGWKMDGFAVKVLSPLAIYDYCSIPTNGALKYNAGNLYNS